MATFEIRTSALPDDRCPACGYELNACSSAAAEPPSPGDLAVCINCGEVLWFDAAMKHQRFPPERIAALDVETRRLIQLAQDGVRRLQARRAGR